MEKKYVLIKHPNGNKNNVCVLGKTKWLSLSEIATKAACKDLIFFRTAQESQLAQSKLEAPDRSYTWVKPLPTFEKDTGLVYTGTMFESEKDVSAQKDKAAKERASPAQETNTAKPSKKKMACNHGTDIASEAAGQALAGFLDCLKRTMEFSKDVTENSPQQLGRIERAIEDELHYIELDDLNAAQGFAAYKRLRELRRERRRIKDSMVVAKMIDDLMAQSIDESSLRKANSQFSSLQNRTYQLREPELFVHNGEEGKDKTQVLTQQT